MKTVASAVAHAAARGDTQALATLLRGAIGPFVKECDIAVIEGGFIEITTELGWVTLKRTEWIPRRVTTQ